MSAFAALSLLCIASSCRDQNFDWENAHALTSVEKFSDTFIKEFGQPAEGHQWGFDLNWAGETSMTRSYAVFKPEHENMEKLMYYGFAPDITNREHYEVREWFSKHKVTWEHTTKVWGNVKDGDVLRDNTQNVFTFTGFDAINRPKPALKSDGKIDGFTFNNGYSFGSVIKGTFTSQDGSESQTGYFTIVKDDASTAYDIVEVVQYDKTDVGVYYGGTASTRGTGLSAVATAPLNDDNSIRKHMDSNYYEYSEEEPITVSVGTTISFNHAWLQHVSFDPDASGGRTEDERQKTADDPSWWTKYRSSSDEVANNGNHVNAGEKMNQLFIVDTAGGQDHTLDFNASNGEGPWGFNRQSETIKYNGEPVIAGGKTHNKNGILLCDADFNNLVYKNSLDGDHLHDKWIIVYLEGDGYAGWYLGMDFEGYGDGTKSDQLVNGNGVCDDWIFKLMAVDPNPERKMSNARIMCEDLGGINNKVEIGTTVHISDIDYNDVVIDVNPSEPYQEINYSVWPNTTTTRYKKVKITLCAAGGTLPLLVCYNDMPLFETHEMFQKGKYYNENDRDVTYSIMYNTSKNEGENFGTADRKEIYLTFGSTNENKIVYNDDKVTIKEFALKDAHYDIEDIQLKVWRHSVQDYKDLTSVGTNFNDADWINLSNQAGDAPLKICVPQTVDWLKEREAISNGYPGFSAWVKDPSDYFWKSGKTINSQYLYNSSN